MYSYGLLAVLYIVLSGIGSIRYLVSVYLYNISEAVILNILDNPRILNEVFIVFNLALIN